MYDTEDYKRLNRLREKYGKTEIPEPKELTEKELEESLMKQQEMDHEAFVNVKKKDERLSRRYTRR